MMFENKEKAASKVLEAARRKLLDTGTRNRLVHVNHANARANCLNIINEGGVSSPLAGPYADTDEPFPPSEIAAAAALVRQESGDVSGEELVRAVARLLGFLRVGSKRPP